MVTFETFELSLEKQNSKSNKTQREAVGQKLIWRKRIPGLGKRPVLRS